MIESSVANFSEILFAIVGLKGQGLIGEPARRRPADRKRRRVRSQRTALRVFPANRSGLSFFLFHTAGSLTPSLKLL